MPKRSSLSIIKFTQTTLCCLGLGFVLEVANKSINATYIYDFFNQNLVTLLVALLAINITTMGIVLTRIKHLTDSITEAQNFFSRTKINMLLSTKEQVVLIGAAIMMLSLKSSKTFLQIQNSEIIINTTLWAIFIFALYILYDTAKSIFIVLDH